MNLHEFIFSDKKLIRFRRHTLFWVASLIFFACTTSSWWAVYNNRAFHPHPGLVQLGFFKWSILVILKTFSILIIQLLATYAFIYVVLPRFLLKRNYLKLATGILIISIFLVGAGYFIHQQVFPILDAVFHFSNGTGKIFLWASINFGLLNTPKVIAAATIIKLLKRWWLKQKEKERLEKEKIDTELELLKAQIHPQFLFNTLNNIYSFALTSSPKSPQMLLKLSEILSYSLYECNDGRVPLEKEIKMLKDYMMLEQIRYGDKLEMNMQVKGDTGLQMIAPLLLLNFIENSFRQCNDTKMEQRWIDLEIIIQDGIFFMQLLNGKSAALVSNTEDDEHLVQVKKRLQLLYPGKYKLKIVEEPEIFILKLEIELTGAFKTVEEKASLSKIKVPSFSYI